VGRRQTQYARLSLVKRSLILPFCAAAFALCVAAPVVSAHEHDVYRVGSSYYVVTVGSLNEPFVVDDLSGVDLRVEQLPGPPAAGAKGLPKGTPVSKLEQTLKVELAAGDKKETLALEPADGAPGSYTAKFIPTVQTTYSYRLFGTIAGNPVDLLFSCAPGEVSEDAQDNSTVKVSDTVTRIAKIGGYGCPEARGPSGFPEPAHSSYELNQQTQGVAAALQQSRDEAARAQALGMAGLGVGIAALAAAILALRRR
jgi:hypothetical protein